MSALFSATTFRRGLGSMAAALALSVSALAAQADTAIKFSLDWNYEGPATPFLVALDKGYFKAEGLDVTIDSASGSLEPLNRLASGGYDMSFGDINSVIKFRDANPDVALAPVFMLYNNPPFSVVGSKAKGINTPKDLEGKKLGAPAADGAYAQWPIFVQTTGIDASKVTIENVGFPVREPMMVSGAVDAITGFSFSTYLSVRKKLSDPDDATVFMMSDYGVKLYGNSVLVHPDFAAKNPDAVKGFVRALIKGLNDTVADPEGSIESVLSRNAVTTKEIELERLNYALDNIIVTDEVKKNGWGAIDEARMAEAIDQIALTYEFKSKPAASAVFDASYLPEAAERQVAQ